MSPFKKDIAVPLSLLIICVLLFIIFSAFSLHTMQAPTVQPMAITPISYALTPGDKEVLDHSNGFQEFISYTDQGFEPSSLSVKSGDTIRFTNNSGKELWIAAGGSDASIYPSVQNGCGSSALDSCRALEPGEFWEFTFSQTGTWSYQNNLNKQDVGSVLVQ